jgi:hypothetical protein
MTGLRPLEELRNESQGALIQFLTTDLEMAATLLQTARVEAYVDPIRVPEVLSKVRLAVSAIRHFSGRLQDRGVWQDFHRRTNEIETELNHLMRVLGQNQPEIEPAPGQTPSMQDRASTGD